jgi:hypothetical protein
MNDRLVYIARALDGSWIGQPTNTELGSQQLIEDHEPDAAKRSNYHILAEPLSKLLANQVAGVTRMLTGKVVKWDGDGPIPDDAAQNPQNYPQVAEVVEGGDFKPTKVIYRRS